MIVTPLEGKESVTGLERCASDDNMSHCNETSDTHSLVRSSRQYATAKVEGHRRVVKTLVEQCLEIKANDDQ